MTNHPPKPERLEEQAHGDFEGERTTVICPSCQGNGGLLGTDLGTPYCWYKCGRCRGTGRVCMTTERKASPDTGEDHDD